MLKDNFLIYIIFNFNNNFFYQNKTKSHYIIYILRKWDTIQVLIFNIIMKFFLNIDLKK